MKITGFILILFSLSISGLGQGYNQIDSMKRLLAYSKEDSSKALVIKDLSRAYLYSNPDSCLFYASLGLELIKDRSVIEKFKTTNNRILSAFEWIMYGLMGTALAEVRNDTLAVKMALKALELCEKSKDKYDVVRIYSSMSEIYQFIGEPGVAIEYLRKEIPLDTSEHSRITFRATLGHVFLITVIMIPRYII